MPKIEDTALIFEGGGMRASATAPMVVTLIEQGIFFPHVSGISAGSSNTVNYISRDITRSAQSWVEFVGDPNMGGMRSWLRGEGYFNSRYIYHEATQQGSSFPFDFQSFDSSTTDFRIGAFRVSDGEEVYWNRASIADHKDLMLKVQASSTMPGIMPFTEIDGEVYADGALGPSGGIALDAAMQDGYKNFVVVLTRPRDYVKKAPRNPQFFRTYFRRTPHVAEGLIERPQNYNHTRQQLFELERQGRAWIYTPETINITNHEMNVAKLKSTYDAGMEQTKRLLPSLKEFLGM